MEDSASVSRPAPFPLEEMGKDDKYLRLLMDGDGISEEAWTGLVEKCGSCNRVFTRKALKKHTKRCFALIKTHGSSFVPKIRPGGPAHASSASNRKHLSVKPHPTRAAPLPKFARTTAFPTELPGPAAKTATPPPRYVYALTSSPFSVSMSISTLSTPTAGSSSVDALALEVAESEPPARERRAASTAPTVGR
ncbi:hypothetical protein DFH09DRAFT_1310871 [Mycena vulgaris]|nr:hypothetical protein DFH09DRAFT_1310871 [Mycena vulgaris]